MTGGVTLKQWDSTPGPSIRQRRLELLNKNQTEGKAKVVAAGWRMELNAALIILL